MKWIHVVALAMIASCLVLPQCFADEEFSIEPLPIAKPSAQTPAVLELTPDIPAATATLRTPYGQYKQLADVAITEINKRDHKARVTAYLRENKAGAKPDLVLAYVGADRTMVTFTSNCAVNSQYQIDYNRTFTLLSDPDKYESPPDISQHLLAGICADWTLLNHDWTDREAVLPKKYRVTTFSGKIDVTYDHAQIRSYNNKIAVRMRSRQVNIANR